MSLLEQPLFLLDFDGVIADTYQQTLDVLSHTFFGISEERFQDSLTRNANSTVGHRILRRITALVIQPRLGRSLGSATVFDGVPQMLSVLAERGTAVVVTSGRRAEVSAFLQRHGLSGYITDIWGGNGGVSKRKGLRQMIATYGRPGQPYVLITDTVGDIRQAVLEGIPTAAVGWGFQDIAILSRENPRFILRQPEDISLVLSAL